MSPFEELGSCLYYATQSLSSFAASLKSVDSTAPSNDLFLLNGKTYPDDEFDSQPFYDELKPMSKRAKQRAAGSWKVWWLVPVEARIRPKSDKFPKKDKSGKTNPRRLRQRKQRVSNKFGEKHAKR
jgi:hypothetical protein